MLDLALTIVVSAGFAFMCRSTWRNRHVGRAGLAFMVLEYEANARIAVIDAALAESARRDSRTRAAYEYEDALHAMVMAECDAMIAAAKKAQEA